MKIHTTCCGQCGKELPIYLMEFRVKGVTIVAATYNVRERIVVSPDTCKDEKIRGMYQDAIDAIFNENIPPLCKDCVSAISQSLSRPDFDLDRLGELLL